MKHRIVLTLTSLAYAFSILHCYQNSSLASRLFPGTVLEAAPVDSDLDFAQPVTITLPDVAEDLQIPFARVDATTLLVRKAPGSEAQAIHRLENGEVVEVLQESGESLTIDEHTGRWTKIRMIVVKDDRPSLLDGWVFGGYLKKITTEYTEPVPPSVYSLNFEKSIKQRAPSIYAACRFPTEPDVREPCRPKKPPACGSIRLPSTSATQIIITRNANHRPADYAGRAGARA